ncbi:MBL fold hydrolase [Bacteroidia bacterium]|nr:MBL fold hydrolase [Bacteroidia bacterium]
MKSMNLSFLSLQSGSSGNCYYLGTPEYGILIDAGIGIRDIRHQLKEHKIDFSTISGLLVTHDHVDHIKTVGCIGEKYKIPVYATAAVHEGIAQSKFVKEALDSSRKVIEKEVPFQINNFRITAFEVPHDSTDNVGYLIEFSGHKFTIVTDAGHITSTISDYVCRANYLVIESNYDREMLVQGSYPQFLKDRITSGNGHLSNQEVAEFLATHYRPHLKNIWLCHLSGDNNHPELARKTICDRLSKEGIPIDKDVSLTVLNRRTPTPVWTLPLEDGEE